jgi:uncharacterized protein YbaP (TraB family)
MLYIVTMKKLSVFVVLLFLGFAIFAQSAVWELSRNGKTLYLGGSVHILREEDFPLPREFDAALDRAGILILEADVERVSDPEFMQGLLFRMFLTDTTLDKLLSPQVFEELANYCAGLGIPISQIIMLKPMVIASMISIMQMQKLKFVEKGVDFVYLEQARAVGKKLGFLESVEFQLDLFFDMGTGYEDELIHYTVTDSDESERELLRLIDEWKRGVPDYMDKNLADMKEASPHVYRDMVLDRNNAWIPQIEAYLETEEIEFILVGYAHLFGPDGLLPKLRDAGVTVKQLSIPR